MKSDNRPWTGVLIWVVSGFMVSALVFSLCAVIVFILEKIGQDAAIGMGFQVLVPIASYGAFHWMLKSVVMLPLFLLPFVFWIVGVRFIPLLECSRLGLLFCAVLFSFLGVLFQTVLMEYPVVRESPLAVLNRTYGLEWISMCGGLLLPRLAIKRIGPGLIKWSNQDRVA